MDGAFDFPGALSKVPVCEASAHHKAVSDSPHLVHRTRRDPAGRVVWSTQWRAGVQGDTIRWTHVDGRVAGAVRGEHPTHFKAAYTWVGDQLRERTWMDGVNEPLVHSAITWTDGKPTEEHRTRHGGPTRSHSLLSWKDGRPSRLVVENSGKPWYAVDYRWDAEGRLVRTDLPTTQQRDPGHPGRGLVGVSAQAPPHLVLALHLQAEGGEGVAELGRAGG